MAAASQLNDLREELDAKRAKYDLNLSSGASESSSVGRASKRRRRGSPRTSSPPHVSSPPTNKRRRVRKRVRRSAKPKTSGLGPVSPSNLSDGLRTSPPRKVSGRFTVSPSPSSIEDERPASPISLEEDLRRRKEDEAIGISLDDLDEVEDIGLPTKEDGAENDDCLSLGSLSSVEEGPPEALRLTNEEVEAAQKLPEADALVDDISVEDEPLTGPAGRAPRPKEDAATINEDLEGSDISQGDLEESDLDYQETAGLDAGTHVRTGELEREEKQSQTEKQPPAQFVVSRHPPPNAKAKRDKQAKKVPMSDGQSAVKAKTCFVCKKEDHLAKDCPDLVCYKCLEPGHFAKECKTSQSSTVKVPPAPTMRGLAIPMADQWPPSLSTTAVAPLPSKPTSTLRTNVVCFNCKDPGHAIKQCPVLVCKRCGAQGHFAKECTTVLPGQSDVWNLAVPEGLGAEREQSTSQDSRAADTRKKILYDVPGVTRRVPPPPLISAKEAISSLRATSGINSVLATRRQAPFPPHVGEVASTKSTAVVASSILPDEQVDLFRHFLAGSSSRAEAEAKSAAWRAAGHTADTLKAVKRRVGSVSKAELKEVLRQELSFVTSLPLAVEREAVLSQTANFLMPTGETTPASSPLEQHDSGQISALKSALRQISSLESFKALGRRFEEAARGGPDYGAYCGSTAAAFEECLRSLVPLRQFIAHNLVQMSMGVSKHWAAEVADTLQQLLAASGLSFDVLKRTYYIGGTHGLTEQVNSFFGHHADKFPSGISVSLVAEMISRMLDKENKQQRSSSFHYGDGSYNRENSGVM